MVYIQGKYIFLCDMVCYDNDRAYPGLIVMAKFFKDIKHKGSKDYYE